jgi:hypothetical protein
MKRLIAVAATAVAVFAFGCATEYQSLDDSITGGYTETRVSPDTWRVRISGNSLTARRDVEQFLMRRAAELTLEDGRQFFVLSEHEAWMRTKRSSSGSVIAMPANESLVTVVDAWQRDAFDAARIIEETNAAAQGRLSAKARATLEVLKRG